MAPIFRPVAIVPSILAGDLSNLREMVSYVEAGGGDGIHVDVMDGHFVPNITMGPCVVSALRRITHLPLDVHLMIEEPGRFVRPFVEAGANHITFHVEAVADPVPLAEEIRRGGCGVGISIRPDTPVGAIAGLLDRLDMVLVMTVYPGFSGQEFLGENLGKIPEIVGLRERSPRCDFVVEVDGGIDRRTIPLARRAGAEVFVAGTAVFGEGDPAAAIRELRGQAEREMDGAVQGTGG